MFFTNKLEILMKVFNRYCADFDIERCFFVFKFSFNMQLFIKKGEMLIDFFNY